VIHIRRAGPLDANALSDLLNAIIAKGGTTAMVTTVSGKALAEWMGRENAIWHLAEDDNGQVKGFQWTEPHPELPPDAVDIASYVQLGETGLGIGSALFEATKAAVRAQGYRCIDAIIRADNSGGLAYYQSRGFETILHLPYEKLDDGRRVDKVWKRYRLD